MCRSEGRIPHRIEVSNAVFLCGLFYLFTFEYGSSWSVLIPADCDNLKLQPMLQVGRPDTPLRHMLSRPSLAHGGIQPWASIKGKPLAGDLE